MAEARLTVRSCGPLVSYQDGGRFGMARFGVPASGPMDRLAHAAANTALGCHPAATTVEVSLGGFELVCESGDVSFAVTGGDFQVVHAGSRTGSWCVRTLRSGEALALRPGRWGSWAYLAFAGELMCKTWAGSASTHSTSGFGGGLLRPGASLSVRHARVAEDREGQVPFPEFAAPRPVARCVLGPQTSHFEPAAIDAFQRERFVVTPAYDRMGVRLSGPPLHLRNALSIPSEPLVRGSVQVGGDGVASILLADHQTTGGYPKVATLLSCDTDIVAQLRPQETVSFQPVESGEAVELFRAYAGARNRYLLQVAEPRGALLDRLMRENLVSGVVWEDAKVNP
jgi:biotin-dependent carboxylase-like uncharacterized protein